ncbi:hypothetical protein ITI46_25570 [Streptomyces oryzae]|uniref:Uncharacterized protein n=1 Tax=Streptomyces oryzae TaxID=1434886 RepID=A0ABS3XHX1_9ACTN|nr:hypothetical protein [Streptomyces oryzae]
MRSLVSTGVAVAVAGLALSLIPSPAYAANSGTDSVMCYKYGPSPYINFSWSTGWTSTKVYYNSHCTFSKKVAFKFYNDGSTPFYKCRTIPAMTKSYVKFDFRNEILDINTNTAAC